MERRFECDICGQENTLEIKEIPAGKLLGAWCCGCGTVNKFPELTQNTNQLLENTDDYLVCVAVEPENRYVGGYRTIGDQSTGYITKWVTADGELFTRKEFAEKYGIDPLYIWCMTRPKHHLCANFEKICNEKLTSELLILKDLE